jgi:hypothetical protein
MRRYRALRGESRAAGEFCARLNGDSQIMTSREILLAAALLFVSFAGVASAAATPEFCTVTDTSNPHFFTSVGTVGVGTPQGQDSAGAVNTFSANNVPCDQVGNDGDNEQGNGGAEMPIAGATCPYAQDATNEQAGGGPITVGHHGDDIWVENTADIDVTWSSGIDGQDPAATVAGQTCTGNGIISADITTDPADCSDSMGANVNVLGNYHLDTDPISVGTNDPNSGFTCFDAVDGNEWTSLNAGPFVGQFGAAGLTAQPGEILCLDLAGLSGDSDTSPTCGLHADLDWLPVSGPKVSLPIVGFSLPVTGTIASGVEE